MSGKGRFVGTYFDDERMAEFEQVKRHYGIESHSDGLRFLVRQEARRIESEAPKGYDVGKVLAGYLGGQITAEEAMREVMSRLGIGGVQISLPILDVQNQEADR